MGADNADKNEDDKDLELDLMAEQELLRLTRQFRVMEGDKEAYIEETTKALRRQRKIIDDLDSEKKELLRQLKSSKSKTNARKESENAAKLARLAEEQESLKTSIQHERLGMADLDSEIRRIERQIASQRRSAASKTGALHNDEASKSPGAAKTVMAIREKKDINQRIVLLENRLDGVLVNFNATLSRNSAIRKEIDHLVQERASFNEMIAKYQKKIAANKKTIADITELAIQAFDQRDECQSKVQALQERNEKDAQQYVAELKELQRTLDHDEKLKDFLFHKSNDRVLAAQFDTDDKEKGKKAAEEKEIEDTEKYKEAFAKIQKVVGTEASLDKIVGDFVKVEDQNFALFNYVTEMNNQVEALQEGINKLKSDIREAKGRGEERERQQREQLESMEKILEQSTHEADTAETKLDLMNNVIKKLKVGAEDLYVTAKVGSTPVLTLLSGSGGGDANEEEPQRPFVNENNIIMYLDMIHEKIVELKGIVQFLNMKENASRSHAHHHHHYVDGVVSSAVGPGAGAKVTQRTLIERQLKRLHSSAQLLGKDDKDIELALQEVSDDESDEAKPFNLSALKTRAFVVAQRERRETNQLGQGSDAKSVPMINANMKITKSSGNKVHP